MRIIRLGNIDMQFCCPNCKTIFEINAKELKEENDHWKIQCPLCLEEIEFMPDDPIRNLLMRRKELEQQ